MEYLNNYKLYFKIISFFIVTNSIAHISPVDTRCVRGCRLVSSRCLLGTHAVLIWCVRGAYQVRVRCLSGAHAVPIWCTRGACLVRAHGACLARPRCVFGSCMASSF